MDEKDQRLGQRKSLVAQIEAMMPDMSKGQRSIAQFILSDYERAAYMTAARIGEKTGVSESTVVRFTMELGFDGYPHFQKALQEELKVKLTYLQRLNASKKYANEEEVLKSILLTDIDNLKKAREQVDSASFLAAVEMILSSKRIFLMGIRSSAPLSSFLHFYFTLLFDDVRHIHSNSANEVFEQILPIGPGDVMIGISFPRYSVRTIQSMQYARQRGASVVAITDKAETPLVQVSDVALYATSDMASFVDSLVAPLSLINALIVALGMRRREHIEQTFDALEKLWDEYKVYDKGMDRPEDQIAHVSLSSESLDAPVRIAIDGPSGSGKSTLARNVASHIGVTYLDTGAMYRAVGYKALQEGISRKDEAAVAKMLQNTSIDVCFIDGEQRMLVDGQNITNKLRDANVSVAASDISSLSCVREHLVSMQRAIAEKQSVVIDGRDIGTYVLPDANYKFFLVAKPEERARRRMEEMKEKGILSQSYEDILRDILYRDHQDTSRKIAPLKQASDAIVIDTTPNTPEQTFEQLLSYLPDTLRHRGEAT